MGDNIKYLKIFDCSKQSEKRENKKLAGTNRNKIDGKMKFSANN